MKPIKLWFKKPIAISNGIKQYKDYEIVRIQNGKPTYKKILHWSKPKI